MRNALLAARIAVAFVLFAGLTAAATAYERVGVVLLHGKTGMPTQFTVLAADLEDLGFPVEVPEMCWSARRIYDRPFTGCMADIDAAIARLAADGITRVVVAGHSLGGVGALAYASTHDGVAGVIALAPAGDPVAAGQGTTLRRSLARARAEVKAGRGQVPERFDDIVLGRRYPVKAAAEDFLTFFGPDSPGVMTRTIPALKVPLLWVAGTRDSSQSNAKALFGKAPKRRLNRYVTVKATHLGTPDAAFDAMADWLAELQGR